MFGREITIHTVIYGVYIRFWPTLRAYRHFQALTHTFNHTHTNTHTHTRTHTNTHTRTHTHTHTHKLTQTQKTTHNTLRFKSSRVRLAALSCLQAMAKAEPRALHAHWTTLLPVQQPLQPRPLSPHIVTMLMHDPVSKVRAVTDVHVAWG